MKEDYLKKIHNIDKIKSEYEINKILRIFFEYVESKKNSIIKEKQKLLKENKNLNNEIEDIICDIKVLENEKNNLIYNSKLKIQKSLNSIEKMEKEYEYKKKMKVYEFESNKKKLENEKNNKINEIYLSFIKEKGIIDREKSKKEFSKKNAKLEYERIRDGIYFNFIKNKKELDCELYDINLNTMKYKSQKIIQMKTLNNFKNIELKKINNEKQLFLKEIELEKNIINLKNNKYFLIK